MTKLIHADSKSRFGWDGKSQARNKRFQMAIILSKRLTVFLGKHFPNAFPLLFVMGFPKSGNTWVCHLLSDYLRIPFPQYSILPIGCPAVVHSFECPTRQHARAVYVMRDGRDAIVSAYFHARGQAKAGQTSWRLRTWFEGLDPEASPSTNMPSFIRRQAKVPMSRKTHWGDHVGTYLTTGNHLPLIRFEDLQKSPVQALSATATELTGSDANESLVSETIDRCSFQRLSGREKGRENRESYLRRGQSGDWRNHFNKEAAEVFHKLFGGKLIEAGYEDNDAWVQECPSRMD